MDDTGLPQISDDLPELSTLPNQDIPEAVREESDSFTPEKPSSPRYALWSLSGLGLVALIAVPLVALRLLPVPSASPPASDVSASPSTPEANTPAGSLLGHLTYKEAPTSELVPVQPDGEVSLRPAAAEKFEEMVAAAAAEGVNLIPLSGFRSIAEQNKLFFEVKAERGEDTQKRAEVSAPPGHSEHHTGYAVDIGDIDRPSTDLELAFEGTEAFKWLKQNAAHYSFEMSFPKDNPMQVSYEPWHWRYVGDQKSLETFYQARNETPAAAANTSNSASDSANSETRSDAVQ